MARELGAKRIWFARALLPSRTAEVTALVHTAKEWADQLGKPVALWISDEQDALVQAIAREFPGVPHRYCRNHFLRDVAKPVLEADSHAKVKMRAKARGLREVEREVLSQRREPVAAPPPVAEAPREAQQPPPVVPTAPVPSTADDAGAVVLGYCSAVRGILNDNQGGPLHPPGVRMAEGLGEVRQSLQRNLGAKKGGPPRGS